MNMDDALQVFIVESRELLEEMEAALLRMLQKEDAGDAINAVFRAAHTIKGSAGLFGLDFIVEFAHVVESLLDEIRDGSLSVDETIVSLLLACGDHIGRLVTAAANGHTEADAELSGRAEPLLAQLHAYLDTEPRSVPSESCQDAVSAPDGANAGRWHISLRFGADVLRNGMDPLSFLRYLGKLGTLGNVQTLWDALPPLARMDAESCYLGFEVPLSSGADRAAIEGAFEFVRDDCELHVLGPDIGLPDYRDLIRRHAGDDQDKALQLGQVLARCAGVTVDTLMAALEASTPPDASAPSAAASLPVPATPSAGARTASRAGAGKEGKPSDAQSIRVDAEKLDRLVDLVGELITASASAMQAGKAVQNTALHEAHSTLSALVHEVRDSALQLRMVRIGATFNRFQRVVHDVSREIGKDIALVISGEDTELDKTVVEKIGDPLTHLVRNSMDHGIEPADVRVARGKPARGCVRLNAYHDSGSIVIEVSDDGGGLSREKILAKAVERGLVDAGKALTDAEVYSLIFEPGFSTAEQVTNLSGRGVGMDVVKRNITALRGAVSVESQPGQGTTVSIRLPLTLAIINGFQIAVGQSVFVLPLEAVDECVEFKAETEHDFTELRDQVLPFIRLRKLFNVPGTPAIRQSVVVVRHAGQRFGLIVDRLVGEAQTVIKPLARMFAHLQGISGSSILGSGEVALILDIASLADLAHSRGKGEVPPLEPSFIPELA